MQGNMTVASVAAICRELCPPGLAESWDNTGLLLGDPEQPVQRVMTCLTLTRRTVGEATERAADMVIVHHPVPFRPLERITTEDLPGWIIWQLARHRISVYSPHTAFDSAAEGINQRLATLIGLQDISPLRPATTDPALQSLGTGRVGKLPEPKPFLEFAQQVKAVLKLKYVKVAGNPTGLVEKVAVGCGAAGELLKNAREAHCQAMVLGEARFHTCVEAEFYNMGLCIVGHYQSERFAVEALAQMLRERLPQLEIWAAQTETDPIRWI